MNGRLVVEGGIELDLSERVPVPLNFSVADAKAPEKRQYNYSAEVSLPGTARNLQYFNGAYSLTITTDEAGTSYAFDPTKRVSFRYYKRSTETFKGVLQLIEVVVHPDKSIELVVTFNSELANLLLVLGDLKLSELGWSEYDHPLSRTNIKKSWDTEVLVNGVYVSNFSGGNPLGFGYLYPLVNYGYPQDTPTTFRTYDLVPLVYAREVLLKSYAVAGMVPDSDWLDSNLIRSKVVGWGGGPRASISPTVAQTRKVDLIGDYTQQEVRQYDNYNGALQLATYHFIFGKSLIEATNYALTAPAVDDLNQYDDPSGAVSVAQTGSYNYAVSGTLNLAFDSSGMVLDTSAGFGQLYMRRNGSVIASSIATFSPSSPTITVNLSGSLSLNSGDVIETWIVFNNTLKYQAATIDDAQSVTLDIDATGLTFTLTAINTSLTDGDTVEMSRFVPDMKAADFVLGLIRGYNLYQADPNEEAVSVLEPLEDYYLPTDQYEDISQIIDNSKKVLIRSASEVEGKTYKFEFQKDEDYDNKRYFDRFGIGYGNRNYDVENAFVTGDRVYTLPFAQSVPVDILGTSLVIPRIISYDEGTGEIKPYKGKPRLYFYNGLKSGNWRLKNTIDNAFEDLTSFPCVHHFDDKDNPTFDFNWALPELLFYTTTEVTTDNLFSRYHERFIREITSRDSKFVTLYLKYTASDIKNINFRKARNWNGVRFRLNVVEDFDDDIADSVSVELIKILDAKNPRRFRFKRPSISFGGITSPIITNTGSQPDVGIISGGVSTTLANSPKLKG